MTKKFKLMVGASLIGSLLALPAVMAQDAMEDPVAPGTPTPTTPPPTVSDTDDGDMDYGWIGLLGLAGLAGLMRKDHKHAPVNRTVTERDTTR